MHLVAILTSLLNLCAMAAGEGRASAIPVDQSDCIIDTWDSVHGLPDNSVTAIAQDKDGYLWMATFGGLVRFDGVAFTVFDQGNTPELPDSTVFNLHIDSRNRLWISTGKGLVVREGNSWRRLGVTDGWSGGLVRSFAENGDGSLLITTFDERLLLADARGMTEIPKPTGSRWLGIAGADLEGHWWLSQPGFIGWWDGLAWVNVSGFPAELEHVSGRARDGGMWAVIGDELLKLDRQAIRTRTRLRESPGGLWGVCEDSRGDVWISTYDAGVLRVARDGAVRRFSIGRGIGSRGVRCVFEDRERNLWIGTSGGGLSRVKPSRVRVFGLESGLDESVVTSVCPDSNDGLLVATYGRGPYRLDFGTGRASPLTGDNEPTAYPNCALHDHRGRIWVGSDGAGLSVYENQTWRRLPERGFGSLSIRSMFEDASGRIWVSAGESVTVVEDGVPRLLTQDLGVPLASVRNFAQDSSGAIWFSTDEAVFRGEFPRFAEVRDCEGHALAGVTSFRFEPDATVWMGTLHSGLLRLRDGRCATIDRTCGLPECSINGILVDPRGIWWLATNRGVMRVAGSELRDAADGRIPLVRVQRLSVSDGLVSGETFSSHQPSCAADSQGRFWFATSRGAAMIDPADITLNEVMPPVRVETISAYLPQSGQTLVIPGGTPEHVERVLTSEGGTTVVIPAGARRLDVRYTALSFVNPERVRFQCSLEGLDPAWQDAGGSRVATYYDPPPGNYTFRVRAANDDGLWNTEGASVRLKVEGFFWQSMWFRGLVTLLVLGVGAIGAGAIGRARLARAGERLTIERQRTELAHLSRVTLLGELSGSLAHELNQPLTAILSNAQAAQRMMASDNFDPGEIREVLGDIVDQDKRAGEVIHRLRRLLRRGEIETVALNMNDLVADSLRLVSRELANRDIEVRTDFERNLPGIMGDRVQLQQVLLNLLLNSADAMTDVPPDRRVLTVRTSADADRVHVRVADTGTGISPGLEARLFEPFYTTKASGMGLGLSVCRTIVRSHGGEIWAESGETTGAILAFGIPVAKGPQPDGQGQPNRLPGR